MDPQATWDQLLAAYAAGDWDVIEERATDLIAWLDRGGFPIAGRESLPKRPLSTSGLPNRYLERRSRWRSILNYRPTRTRTPGTPDWCGKLVQRSRNRPVRYRKQSVPYRKTPPAHRKPGLSVPKCLKHWTITPSGKRPASK